MRHPILRTFALVFLALVTSGLLAACGSDRSSRRRGQVVDNNVEPVDRENLDELDSQIENLEARTGDLRARLDKVQGKIADATAVEQLASLQANMSDGRTFMELDRSDIFRVNGIVMDMGDFRKYASRQGKDLCQPTPVLVVAPESDYEQVASIMDVVYNQNCANLDIVEQNPDQLLKN